MSTNGRTGVVEAVCVVHALRPSGVRRYPETAIDKRPVDGPVAVGPLGLTGDRQCDTAHHGGPFKAVYAYSDEEARRWERELDRTLPPGWFGENLRVSGTPVTDAVVGERWTIGDADLEVVSPRTPCGTFTAWSGERGWAKRFTQRGDTGAYLRVVVPGTIRAGDRVEVRAVPAHGVTIRDVFTRSTDPDRAAAAVAELVEPDPDVLEHLSAVARS